jgi:hypothetical protein
MATIRDIVNKGELELFQLPDWESRLPINPLYIPPSFLKWIDQTKELSDEKLKIGPRTLLEHLEQTLCDFRCSDRPSAGDLKRMMPTKHGIWKLHPNGLRLYGWCPAPMAFVVVTGALESESKTNKKLNDVNRDTVREFIKTHKLDGSVVRGDILAIFPPQAK